MADTTPFLGRYCFVSLIAKGGMGEVYKVFDVKLERTLALKKIRSDLVGKSRFDERFLKECKIVAKLSHPSIIPILEIGDEIPEEYYYTMPLITGMTFRDYVKNNCIDVDVPSLPVLVRHFVSICEGLSHAHQSGVLHRDIKAENIMIGPHNDVVIVDWGLACESEFDGANILADSTIGEDPGITKAGKCPGTLNYIAPERLFGPATKRSDIYSLGILLHFLLAKRVPFKRKSIKIFRNNWSKESLIDWKKLIRKGNIPEKLIRIVSRCIETDSTCRYSSVEELLIDVEDFFDGRFSWNFACQLSLKEDEVWEKKGTTLVEQRGICPSGSQITHLVTLNWFASKICLHCNFRFESVIKATSCASGFGLLFDLPENISESCSLDGGLLWIDLSCGEARGSLYRNGTVVSYTANVVSSKDELWRVTIERKGFSVFVYINDLPPMVHVSCFPMSGKRLGFLLDENDICVVSSQLFCGGVTLKPCCLGVPDHLFCKKSYSEALEEYKKIGNSFVGCDEGSEAIFRGGLVLIELAKYALQKLDYDEKDRLLDQSMREFERLRNSAFSPFEYLGKSFAYRVSGDSCEEIKCLELCCVKFKGHKKLKVLEETIVSRLHDSAHCSGLKTRARLALAIARSVPHYLVRKDVQSQISSIKYGIEFPSFWLLKSDKEKCGCSAFLRVFACVEVAFILGDWISIESSVEMFFKDNVICAEAFFLALYSLIIFGRYDSLVGFIDRVMNNFSCFFSMFDASKHEIDNVCKLYKDFAITYELNHDLVVSMLGNEKVLSPYVSMHFCRILFVFSLRVIESGSLGFKDSMECFVGMLHEKFAKDLAWDLFRLWFMVMEGNYVSVLEKAQRIITVIPNSEQKDLLPVCACALYGVGELSREEFTSMFARHLVQNSNRQYNDMLFWERRMSTFYMNVCNYVGDF